MHPLVKEAKEIYKKNKHLGSDSLVKAFKKAGWKQTKFATFKKVLVKRDLVVKFPDDGMRRKGTREIKKEVSQYKTGPKWLKKNLAKLHTHIDNLIIQERVRVCGKKWSCRRYYAFIEEIAEKYYRSSEYRAMTNLNDGGHNHGHKGDEIVFFDWVYKR